MKITYDDKVSLTTSPLPRPNKCTADDLNEIKNTVNENAGEILYESENGTTGDVSLSDNATNYDYIEIFAHTLEKSFSEKIYKPNNKDFSFNISNYYNHTTPFYILYLTQLNGIYNTTIRRGQAGGARLTNSGTIQVYDENNPDIYIDKVIGYKS